MNVRATHEVIVVGGGIAGVSAAQMLAERGAAVTVIERATVGAAASGRNSGSLQRPADPVLAPLHDRTMELYRKLADADPEFELPRQPAGLLLLGRDRDAVAAEVDAGHSAGGRPPALVGPHELRRLEPGLADGLWGAVIPTGYPVVPSVATHAYARRAETAGAKLVIGDEVLSVEAADGADGATVRLASGRRLRAEAVLLAAGPWTPSLAPGRASRPAIRPIWGVVVAVRLAEPPRHILEEVGVRSVDSAMLPFTLVTAGGVSAVGSTFLPDRPSTAALGRELLDRGTAFVPRLADAEVIAARACARPVSLDGRPLVGALPDMAGVYICAGHGPWGMSTGPATAELVTQQILGDRTAGIPDALAPLRFVTDT